MTQILNPLGALFFVFAKNIMVFFEMIPNQFQFFRMEFGMHHILTHRDPQIFKLNPHRADFLAMATQGTLKDRVTEMLPLVLGQFFASEKFAE
jgi:hypothetical protein